MSQAILLLLGLAFFHTSCESVVDVELPAHESRISAYCMSGNLTPSMNVCVGRSAGFIENDATEFLTDVDIQFKKNGDYVLTNFNGFPVDGCYNDNNNSQINDPESEYELEIRHPDFETIRAKQIAPHPPVINDVNYDVVGVYDPFRGVNFNRMTVAFTDDPNARDYYHVHGYLRNICCPEDFYSIWTWSDNFVLQETVSSQGLIFDDNTFNGSEYILDLKLDDTYFDPSVHYLYVRFSRITRDRYLYLKSRKAYEDAQNNPFAEPVTVHSNFENGYGIFGLEASNMYFVE